MQEADADCGGDPPDALAVWISDPNLATSPFRLTQASMCCVHCASAFSHPAQSLRGSTCSGITKRQSWVDAFFLPVPRTTASATATEDVARLLVPPYTDQQAYTWTDVPLATHSLSAPRP